MSKHLIIITPPPNPLIYIPVPFATSFLKDEPKLENTGYFLMQNYLGCNVAENGWCLW